MTHPDVAVMYTDLEIKRVPWAEKESLLCDGVLAVSVVHPGRSRDDTHWRGESFSDYYVLAWTDEDYTLFGYDAGRRWRSLEWPLDARKTDQALRLPYTLPDPHIIFVGKQVADEVWREAQARFWDPERGMIF